MRILFTIAFVLLVSGCGVRTSDGAEYVEGAMGSGEVKIVTLDDGTRCAVLIGNRQGALSCDWGRN